MSDATLACIQQAPLLHDADSGQGADRHSLAPSAVRGGAGRDAGRALCCPGEAVLAASVVVDAALPQQRPLARKLAAAPAHGRELCLPPRTDVGGAVEVAECVLAESTADLDAPLRNDLGLVGSAGALSAHERQISHHVARVPVGQLKGLRRTPDAVGVHLDDLPIWARLRRIVHTTSLGRGEGRLAWVLGRGVEELHEGAAAERAAWSSNGLVELPRQ
mmetsp:Transcript_60124/g.172649  ORF Transcript_60124/g.172649 Transcript_60124/m.172649 type:complete len:219 (-) Transcript_60124:497-1153(-)